MVKPIYYVLLLVMISMGISLLGDAYHMPVVFKAVNGEVCGCAYPGDVRLTSCDNIDLGATYEVVTMRDCFYTP